MNRIKAYVVTDSYDGDSCIEFATNGATARRNGGNELGCEWEGVQSCRRKPEFDQFAPGPVPPMTLLENGWWFDCHNHACQRRVSFDDSDPPMEPCVTGQRVYCSQECRAADARRNRANARPQGVSYE